MEAEETKIRNPYLGTQENLNQKSLKPISFSFVTQKINFAKTYLLGNQKAEMPSASFFPYTKNI